jgi:hypothetical protein
MIQFIFFMAIAAVLVFIGFKLNRPKPVIEEPKKNQEGGTKKKVK